MARITFWFNDTENYVSVEADLLLEENDGFIKAYTKDNELVGMFRIDSIKGAYKTEERKTSK